MKKIKVFVMLLTVALLLSCTGCGENDVITASTKAPTPTSTQKTAAEPTKEPTATPTPEPAAEPTKAASADPVFIPAASPINFIVADPELPELQEEDDSHSAGFGGFYYYTYYSSPDRCESIYRVYDYSGNNIVNFYQDVGIWSLLTTLRTSDIIFAQTRENLDYSDYSLKGVSVIVYDNKGKLVYQKDLDSTSAPAVVPDNWEYFTGEGDFAMIYPSNFYGRYVELSKVDDWNDPTGIVWCYLNVDTGELVPPETAVLPETDTPLLLTDYDTSKWLEYSRTVYDDLFLGASAENHEWCYVRNGEVVASFMDASGFSYNGYSLVSFDRKTYYFIDSDFNVIQDYTFEGVNAMITNDFRTFVIMREDGTRYAVHME